MRHDGRPDDDPHQLPFLSQKCRRDEREVEAAGRAILSGWVTQGPQVAAFEKEFAAAVGAASRLRRVQLHDGTPSRPAGPGSERGTKW